MVVVGLKPESPACGACHLFPGSICRLGEEEEAEFLKGPPLTCHLHTSHLLLQSPSQILLDQSRALLSRLNLQNVSADTYQDTWTQLVQPKAEMGFISAPLPLSGCVISPPPQGTPLWWALSLGLWEASNLLESPKEFTEEAQG